MGIFLSEYNQKLDVKKRVSIPTEFRKVLGDEGVILYRSYKQARVLEGCTLGFMQELSETTNNFDLFDTTQDDAKTSIFADACLLKFDPNGRVTLPERFIEHCNLQDCVGFIGRGKTFQVWNPENLKDYIESARSRVKIEVKKRGLCERRYN